jgi:hypothetical protein
MDSLDLDINNYSTKDLVKFFRFSATDVLTPSAIELKEAETRELLLSSGHIDKKHKRDLISFLNDAKTLLINQKCQPSSADKNIAIKDQIAKQASNKQLDQIAKQASNKQLDQSDRTEELNVRIETPFLNTSHSDYFAGSMNPLKTRIITKIVNVDTRFREASASSDMMIMLPQKMPKVVSMNVSAIEFPMTFYNISEKYGNNHFYMCVTTQKNADVSNNEFTITIPDGNYSDADLIVVINNLITTQPSAVYFDASFNIDLNANRSGTGKVILTTAGKLGSTVKNVKLDFIKNANSQTDILYKFGHLIGFTKKIYDGATRYVSDTMPDSNHIHYLYLAIDDFNNSVNNNFISAFNKSILSPNILARLSVQNTPNFRVFSGNEFNMIVEPRKYFGPVDIQKINVKIYDDMGRMVDLNGANFSFCLTFKTLYDL